MQNATAEERRAFQEKVNEMQQQLLQMDHERMEEVARVKDEISTRLDAEYNQKFRDLQDELAKQGLVTQQAESLRKQLELELHKIRTENAQLRKKRDGCTLL